MMHASQKCLGFPQIPPISIGISAIKLNTKAFSGPNVAADCFCCYSSNDWIIEPLSQQKKTGSSHAKTLKNIFM
jgi:hypothetical protein